TRRSARSTRGRRTCSCRPSPNRSLDSTAYLRDVVRIFKTYKALAERAIAQVPSDADLHTQVGPESNSIAVIVKHLGGNLRSRFRDFLTTDGEKPDRDRDDEFEMPERASRDEMLRSWHEGW